VDTVELDVGASLADTAVTPDAFAAVQFVGSAVHPDQEHVQVCQQDGQIGSPATELDNVLNDQVMPVTAKASRH
jgi:hypothetical protein